MKKYFVFLIFSALSIINIVSIGQTIKVEKQQGVDLIIQVVDKPVTPPQPIPTKNIDNVNSHIVYNGSGWYSGETTAPDFYPKEKPTIAYASTAGNTAILEFTGTYFEAFCEKKVGHGSGAFQIDNQTPITIPLGVDGPKGSVSVFKVENLSTGKHTFKLTIVGGGNVVFDYAKINGETVAPTPPPSTGTIIQPGQSIKSAVESAVAGTTFILLAGNYTENIVNVPPKVKIEGAGIDKTFINHSGIHPYNSETAVFQFKSSSRVNGDQTISGMTIKGFYAYSNATAKTTQNTNGGIMIDNRDNVKILNVKVENTTFSGIWLKNANNAEVANCETLNASWASTGWCSGELNIFNTLSMNIHHNVFKNTLNTKGYGIKAMWGNGTFSGVISDNTFNLVPSSIWNNGSGPNIDIEFHDAWVATGNVLMTRNKLTNMISAAGNKTTGNTGRWVIESNEFHLQSGSTCVVEVACNNIDIKKNIMRGASIITANYQPNAKYTDCQVDSNDFVSNNANPGWGGTFLIGPLGVTNMNITNNKITKGNYTLVKYMGTTGGVNVAANNVIN